jgi:hypothetical protein
MKRALLLAGLGVMLAAGTASAQTSVQLSIGFGVPRPYLSGVVIVGRPLVRPVYRPYCYRPGRAFRSDEDRRIVFGRPERRRHGRREGARRFR